MPRMSGFELLERLTDGLAHPDEVTVVVMLTSSSYFADHERALQFDLVSGYLEKPLTAEHIEALIDEHWPVPD